MSLCKKLIKIKDDAINNRKQLLGFAVSTGGSYLIGLIATEGLRKAGLDADSNSTLTWIARTASFYGINIPYHWLSHRQDYLTNTRNQDRETKVISFSNGVGTLITLLQKPAHEYLMQRWNNIWAYGVPYALIGGGAAVVKFAIDKHFKVYRSKKENKPS